MMFEDIFRYDKFPHQFIINNIGFKHEPEYIILLSIRNYEYMFFDVVEDLMHSI